MIGASTLLDYFGLEVVISTPMALSSTFMLIPFLAQWPYIETSTRMAASMACGFNVNSDYIYGLCF